MVSTDVVDEAGKRATLRNFFIRIKVRILILSMLFIRIGFVQDDGSELHVDWIMCRKKMGLVKWRVDLDVAQREWLSKERLKRI
jgi:hypothetical protein